MTNTVSDILNPVLSFLETHSLAELREAHGIRYNVKGHLVTLAYDQFEAKIDNNVSNLCRGLVIAREDGSSAIDVNSTPFGKARILAFPFIRFFNYGQGDSHKALDAFKIRSVMEKLDGTLCIVYHDPFGDCWQVATRNVPDGSNLADGFTVGSSSTSSLATTNSLTFRGLFEKAAIETTKSLNWSDFLCPAYTYVFELMTPVNQVVVRHDSYKIALIGLRNIKTGNEEPISMYRDIFPLPDEFEDLLALARKSLFDKIVEAANERDPLKHEGYVVLGNDWERFKIKSSAYVTHGRIHDFNAYDIANCILTGEIDDFVPLMNDSKKELVILLSEKIANYCHDINHEFNELKKLNGSFACKRDFALHVQKNKKLCQHGRYVYRAYDESVMGVNGSVLVDVQESIKQAYYDSNNNKKYSDSFLRTLVNEWI